MKTLLQSYNELLALKEKREKELHAWEICDFCNAVITLDNSNKFFNITVKAIDNNGDDCESTSKVFDSCNLLDVFQKNIDCLKRAIERINKEIALLESFDVFLENVKTKTGFSENEIMSIVDYEIINPE